MSIWASMDDIGQDDNDQFDGAVVSYINGWSNHYPGHFPPHIESRINEETPASIGTGWMPSWCVPGHHDIDEATHDVDTHIGPWLRLDVYMREVSLWTDPPTVSKPDCHSVCLNEDAVRKLRDNLSKWLERKKVHPAADLESR